MPLSEHEQRLLEQMERALYAEDPNLASTLRSGTRRTFDGRRIALGVVLFLVGIAGLLAGVIVSLAVVGVLGFLFMLGGVLVGGTGFRSSDDSSSDDVPTVKGKRRKTSSAASSGGFMNKMEERWKKRREGDGF